MANEPHGDVEVLLSSAPHTTSTTSTSTTSSRRPNKLHLRLRQRRRVLEIHKHVSNQTGRREERSTKVLPLAFVAGSGYRVDFGVVEEEEEEVRVAVEALRRFLEVCRAVERGGGKGEEVEDEVC